ncbi:MAG: Xaa-Pro peptidase family protein [Myxococcota bacterium]
MLHRVAAITLLLALLGAEITPAEAADPIYAQRRRALLQKLGSGIAVLYAASGERSPSFRQDPDFFYLTGIEEPGAILILSPGAPVRKEVLLLANRDPDLEIWEGERPPISAALRDRLGIENVARTSALNAQLQQAVRHGKKLHLLTGPFGPEDSVPRDLEIYQKLSRVNPDLSIENSAAALESMRLIKDETELAKMRRAVEITHAGLKAAIAAAKPGATEIEVAAALDAAFRKAGAQRHAFDPIIGSAEHSTTLHYPVPSNRRLEAGSLLVLDVGAEFEGYAADITRTIPVGGHFSAEQRKVYETVLAAQQAAFKVARPGVSVRGEVHAAARAVIKDAGWEDAFVHGIGHYVGLEVHDRGDVFAPLAAGMVITIEPGIYLREQGLGVRIEDEVLITKTGAVWLSEAIPRSAAEIEAWAAQ